MVLKTKDDKETILCVTCKEVRLVCSEDTKRCFEVFISPRNWIIINLSLFAILATVCDENSG